MTRSRPSPSDSSMKLRPLLHALSTALILPMTTHAAPADLPLQSITLYASGVGHFRHAGPVPAGAEVTLSLTADELNDALKSLTVGGTGGSGGVSVSYPGQAGIDERLAAFGVDVRGVDSRFALLERLRGVPVRVTLGGGDTQAGRVLAVEERKVEVGEDVATRRVLTLVSEEGLLDVDLEKVSGLKIDDERLRGELASAMELLAGQRDTRRKPLVLTFAEASDAARVSYLAAAPLWKLSYRLDLSGDTPRLQGWAIVDNTSDRDWEGVSVTLVSGRPASFVQDLYTPEYLDRPVVRPERFAGLVPVEHDQEGRLGVDVAGESAPMRLGRALKSPAAPTAGAGFLGGGGGGSSFADDSVASAAEAADLGELFAYTLKDPVDLDRGASAMLPVLDGEVGATRVSIFNAGVLAKHPMRGVRLKNTTDLKLDAGPVTVLDGGAYAGDARLGFTAPGDDRLLTYAVDLEVTATTEQDGDSTRTAASFDRGALIVRVRDVRENRYGFRNASSDARDLLVEVPRLGGYELLDPPAGVETTADRYRVPLAVDAGGQAEAKISQVRTRAERVSLIDLDGAGLDRIAIGTSLDAAAKAKLAEAAKLRRSLTEAERAVEALDAERDRIAQEQARIRENLRPLDRDSALRQRYVKMLDTQEDRLAEIIDERKRAEATVAERQAAFEAFLAGL